MKKDLYHSMSFQDQRLYRIESEQNTFPEVNFPFVVFGFFAGLFTYVQGNKHTSLTILCFTIITALFIYVLNLAAYVWQEVRINSDWNTYAYNKKHGGKRK